MENNFRKYNSIKVSFYNLMFLFEYFLIFKGKSFSDFFSYVIQGFLSISFREV